MLARERIVSAYRARKGLLTSRIHVRLTGPESETTAQNDRVQWRFLSALTPEQRGQKSRKLGPRRLDFLH